MKYTDMTKQAWNLFNIGAADKKPVQTTANSSDAIARGIRKIVAQQGALNEKDVADNAWITDDLNFDDLDRIELAMALEENYGVPISDDTIARWGTVQDIINWRRGIAKPKVSNARCSNCGAKLPVGSNVCPACGSAKLNKAQESIMNNAGKYKSSNELLRALQASSNKATKVASLAGTVAPGLVTTGGLYFGLEGVPALKKKRILRALLAAAGGLGVSGSIYGLKKLMTPDTASITNTLNSRYADWKRNEDKKYNIAQELGVYYHAEPLNDNIIE